MSKIKPKKIKELRKFRRGDLICILTDDMLEYSLTGDYKWVRGFYIRSKKKYFVYNLDCPSIVKYLSGLEFCFKIK